MKLVDMRGLKPRPLLGPGSIPGMGTWPFSDENTPEV